MRVFEESPAEMATETDLMLPNDGVDTVIQNFEELAKCEITSKNCKISWKRRCQFTLKSLACPLC